MQPAHFAEAYVPVLVGGHPVAIVAAFVDETEQRNNILSTTFLLGAIALCLLTGLSFGIPAIAWYRRTKEKQQADRRIQFLAHHDVLTGLANRARLIERLEAALAVLPTTGGMLAVHFIDIDHFKQVNDTLGHDGGDFLLNTIGQRLSALTRIEDMVARLGGDEFVVVQTGIADKAQAERFRHSGSCTILSEPVYFKEQEICVELHDRRRARARRRRHARAPAQERRSRPLRRQRPPAATASASSRRKWTRRCKSASRSNSIIRDAVDAQRLSSCTISRCSK